MIKKNKKEDKVLVLIQTYNDGEFLLQSINSLLKQTYKNIDILILDDGSNDENKKIYEKFVKTNKRIRYIYKINTGIIDSSILLMKTASKTKYKYFAKMDGDDLSDKNRIKEQLFFLKKNNYDLVGCDYVRMNSKNKVFEYNKCTNNKISRLNQLMVESIFTHGSILFKRSLLDKKILKYDAIDNDLPFPEDYNMFNNIIHKAKIGSINKPLYKYRIHNKSYSESNKTKYKKQLIIVSRRFFSKNKKFFFRLNKNFISEDFFDLIIFFKILLRNKLWNESRILKIIYNNFTFKKIIQIVIYYLDRKIKKFLNV